MAQSNVATLRESRNLPIRILQQDALQYSEESDDEVIFMYNPFSAEFLAKVVQNLAKHAKDSSEHRLIIYSERLAAADTKTMIFDRRTDLERIDEYSSLGQIFWVYKVI